MTNSWLPTWLGIAWSVVYLAVLGIHLTHLAGASRRAQAWHGAHALMALGMVDMYWPGTSMPVTATVGEVVFGLGFVAVLALLLADVRRQLAASAVWLVTAVDMGAMVVMFSAMSHPADLLAKALTVWFVAETVGWATGYLSPDGVHPVQAAVAVTSAAAISDKVVPAGSGQAALAVTASQPIPAAQPIPTAQPIPAVEAASLRGASAVVSRLSLVLMSLGMAYMFLVLQVGGAAGGMPGMPGMS